MSETTYKLSDVTEALKAEGITSGPRYSTMRKLTHQVLGFTEPGTLRDTSEGFSYTQEEFNLLVAACRLYALMPKTAKINDIVTGKLGPEQVEAYVTYLARVASQVAPSAADDARLLAASAA